MSIWHGRDGYDPISEFTDRTTLELADREGRLFKRDTEPPADEVEWIRERLRGHKSVLELGCGLGIWAKVAAEVGCEYVGVDPVYARIDYARTHNPGVLFYHDDARSVRLGREFSAVLFCTVLQHVGLQDSIDMLATAAAHLEPGGEIVLMEARILDATEEECERLYALPSNAQHMIPSPLSVLKAALPGFTWDQQGHDRFIVTAPA